MAFDPQLAQRLRERLSSTPHVTERKMFGGLGFMIGGHMAVGVQSQGNLIVRCGADAFETLTARACAGPMLRGGKPVTGWVLVDGGAVAEDEALDWWVAVGVGHAGSLEPKR